MQGIDLQTSVAAFEVVHFLSPLQFSPHDNETIASVSYDFSTRYRPLMQ